MSAFRCRLLRIALALSWLLGSGTMSLEAMLPDTHVPHGHAEVATLGADAATQGQHDTDVCHCTHAHAGGVIELATSFDVSAVSHAPLQRQSRTLLSRATAPPLHPPRA
jgi:hypothetical protein